MYFLSKGSLEYDNQEHLQPDVYQKMFIDIFGQDKADYMLKVLARGVAGETRDKSFYLIIGETNSGKGCICDGLMRAFSNVFGNLNSGDFAVKRSDGDAAKFKSWMVAVRNKRVAVMNESSMKSPLDASVIKYFSGGGDPITARQNYKNECTFKMQSTFYGFMNDLPKIDGANIATVTRIKVITTEYSYLDGENYDKMKNLPNVRKADADIKNVYLKRTDVMQAFAAIICNSYEPDKPYPPTAVINDSAEWTQVDNINNKIIELIEPTGDQSDFITAERLFLRCKGAEIEISKTRLGKLMTKWGYNKSQKKMQGKNLAVYLGVKFSDD